MQAPYGEVAVESARGAHHDQHAWSDIIARRSTACRAIAQYTGIGHSPDQVRDKERTAVFGRTVPWENVAGPVPVRNEGCAEQSRGRTIADGRLALVALLATTLGAEMNDGELVRTWRRL